MFLQTSNLALFTAWGTRLSPLDASAPQSTSHSNQERPHSLPLCTPVRAHSQNAHCSAGQEYLDTLFSQLPTPHTRTLSPPQAYSVAPPSLPHKAARVGRASLNRLVHRLPGGRRQEAGQLLHDAQRVRLRVEHPLVQAAGSMHVSEVANLGP